ncbi:uncharacterized protein EV420DRAFT_1482136 [Desarmillaria tabescens]|uniref:Protein kinase domain-containing protein n=1 Tax=Armillaria tabescens TaxID=1929756 RepID=A0AA39K1G4_ARMTA|nr:uncharacterized protein EV420DRAFT_1482136 [Desarmillaria tabescens]KAK0452841.1 hypothetical protein EV420DRAFT_1482136 [Desarmillaria tabescens]
MYGDIQCRENWSKKSLIGQIEQGPIHMGEILKYVADVSTSNRVMVVKEYSGSAGLLQWKTDFDLHSKAPRHPNFRQLYGVVKSRDWPCLVFHGADDEIPYCQYPKLFDKRIQPLAKSVLSLLKFLISCWGVTLNESTARCSPDGRLIFDDLEELSWATTWDKIYVNDFENILGPVPPAVQWSLNLLMLRPQEPSVQKEHLIWYFHVLSVGTPWSMFPDVDIVIPNSTHIGTIVISDPLEHRHFTVNCLGDGIPPVKLSIQSYATGELLELPNGLWRFIRPQTTINESESFIRSILPEAFDLLGLGFTCSMELTSDARSQHLCSWFSQGPRILAKISETLNDNHHPELVVSQFNKRRFQIRVLRSDSEVDSDSLPPDIPYIFIDLPFMCQNGKSHSITLPDVYLSMDPQGARPGSDCAWKNLYKLEVVDMGDSGLFVSRVNLKMACFLQERCGFRTTSVDAAIFLNQRELTFQMINDEAIRNALSNGVDISVCDDQEDFPVRWEELKEYSALLKCYDGIELLPEDRDTPSNEIVQIPEDELNLKSYSGAHNAGCDSD